MTKFTKFMKEQTINRLLAHRYTGAVNDIRARRKSLADTCYVDTFGMKAIGEMNKLPSGWLKTTLSGRAVFGASYATIRMNGVEHRYDTTTAGQLFNMPSLSEEDESGLAVRVPFNKDGGIWITYEATDAPALEYEAIEADWSRLVEEVRQVKAKAFAVIEYCRTTEKAIEKWPEIEPFIKPDIPSAAPSTAYAVGNVRKSGTNAYRCTTAGTSSSSTAQASAARRLGRR